MSEGYEIDQRLLKLANEWSVYWEDVERPVRRTASGVEIGGDCVKITRCADCKEEIFSGDGHVIGAVRHLLTSHGYRMDGRQFDNRNRLVGRA